MTELKSNFPLNDQQKQAVLHTEGPLLVIAGAGSGKTRVVIEHIIHLVNSGVSPLSIVGVTFTNKAAAEMQERLTQAGVYSVLISTFHSLGVRILRENLDVFEYSQCNIYDTDDCDKLLKPLLVKHNLEGKGWREHISRAKNALIHPSDRAGCAEICDDISFPDLYQDYQDALQSCQAFDFDDLLIRVVELFETKPDRLAMYQQRWQHLLIDEYQDTNGAQHKIALMLAEKHQNLFAVGDPDQSIYSWRGAEISNILDFNKHFSSSNTIYLEQNYRSTQPILSAANSLIVQNSDRFDKELWTDKEYGDLPLLYTGGRDYEEVNFVMKKILGCLSRGVRLSDIVIFYRTNFQSRSFEDALLSNNITYQIIGGLSFYQRKEIKDITAYLKFIHNPHDKVAFTRLLTAPKKGVGPKSIEKMTDYAASENLNLMDVMQHVVDQNGISLPAKARNAIARLNEQMISWSSQANMIDSLISTIIEDTQYLDYLYMTDENSFDERKQNVHEFVTKASTWAMRSENPTLSYFLEEIALKSEAYQSHQGEKLSLMTIHNGKGLEFDTVFIVGLEEDLLPHANSKQFSNQLEEERRLCYVAMTRARKQLYLSHVLHRYIYGTLRPMQPSRFLREISPELLDYYSNN